MFPQTGSFFDMFPQTGDIHPVVSRHCVVGQCTAEGLGDWFYKSSTQASSNYGIDKDGRVGMYARMGDLAEKVTKALQGADSGGGSDSGDKETVRWYRVRKTWADSKSQKGAYKVLANAKKCADQNLGYKVFDADGKVVYELKAAEPSEKVPFLVQVKISNLNIRKGPGTNFDRVKFCPPGIYTIVAVSDGAGARSWGKLKSGIGWIALEYTVRL